jgi:outer membrane protein assembly factor BamA
MQKIKSIVLFLAFCCMLPTYSQGQTVNSLADTTSNRWIYLSNIYILGNKKTRDEIILRELTFEQNKEYRLSDLNELLVKEKQKISNLRLFNSVDLSLAEPVKGNVELLIQVTERWYTFPIPLFELADRNFNDWWVNRNRDFSRVNYGGKLYKYNMRGRNERLRLIAQTGFTNKFELNYRVPYISKKQKEGMIFNVSYKDRKNLAYITEDHLPRFTDSENIIHSEFDGSVSYSFRASFYSFHYVSLGYTNTTIGDTVRSLNPDFLVNGKLRNEYFNLGYTFVRDLRDFVNYPLTGFYLRINTRKMGLGIYDDIDTWKTSLLYSRYFDLGKNWYFSSTATGSVSLPLDQPYFLFEGLGFNQNIIRGFELDVIEGPRYLITKSNIRKRVLNSHINLPWVPFEQFRKVPIAMYVKAFFDAGRVQNFPLYTRLGYNDRLSNNLLYGVGLGVDIVSFYDFVIRPEYSLNSEGEFNFFLNFKADF